MRRSAATIVLAALCGAHGASAWAQAAAPAQAAGPWRSKIIGGDSLQIRAGERVTVTFDDQRRPTIVAITRAEPADVLPPAAGSKLDPDKPLSQAAAGAVEFSLTGSRETGSVLKVDSGLEAPFAYRGAIVVLRDGQVAAALTSTCSVLPGRPTYERWPQPVLAVVAARFEDAPGPPRCR